MLFQESFRFFRDGKELGALVVLLFVLLQVIKRQLGVHGLVHPVRVVGPSGRRVVWLDGLGFAGVLALLQVGYSAIHALHVGPKLPKDV